MTLLLFHLPRTRHKNHIDFQVIHVRAQAKKNYLRFSNDRCCHLLLKKLFTFKTLIHF